MGFLTDQQLESMVLDLVHRVRLEHQLPTRSPATDVCTALGLCVSFANLNPDQDGLIRGKDIIINRRIDLPTRVEYTVFHEIIHYLLEQDGELYEYATDKLARDEKAFDRAIERWCQLGAAEFMLPRSEVYALIGRDGFSIRLIPTLMSELSASLVASGIQLAVCAPVNCYLLICRHGRLPRFPYSTTLFIEQASHRLGQKYIVARGTTIPQPHPLWEAWEHGASSAPASIVPFRSGNFLPCRLTEAIRVGSQVAGLLCLDNPPPPGQLSLF